MPSFRRKRAYVALAVALVFIATGTVGLWRTMAARQRVVRVDARISQSQSVPIGNEGGPGYRTQLVVEYTANQQQYSTLVSVPGIVESRRDREDRQRRYRIGSTVKIRYDVARPEDIELDTGATNVFYLGPLILLAAGLAALTFALLAVAMDNSRSR